MVLVQARVGAQYEKKGTEKSELTHMEIKPKTLPSNLLTGHSEKLRDAFLTLLFL